MKSFQVGNNEVYQEPFPKESTKKNVGIDSISPKPVKMGAERLSQPVTEAINMCIKQNLFPNNAKVACVAHLDKGKLNKYDISIFKPVSI